MFLRGQTLGKYRVLSHLGSGGFGSVYLAEDIWIDKKVALKVPHKQHLDFGEMIREPRLLASMSHPNIVTMLTAERVDDVFFIVLEYVPGETLEQLIVRQGALDVLRALDFTCQMCNAVDHAHRAGILHRDLRPGNMLVSESGLLKVTDFGTSRLLESAAHGTTVIGSPPYMAPEQFYGKAVFASDLYSIGVTMYQMLTGDLPYQTPAPADLERLMRGDLVVAPRVKNARIPRAISDIVLRALAPDVARRYQRASELLDDVLSTRPAALKSRRYGTRTEALKGRRYETRTEVLRGRRSEATTEGLKGRRSQARTEGPKGRRADVKTGALKRAGADAERDTMAARGDGSPNRRRARPGAADGSESVADIQTRLRARETPQPRFCWHCRKPLHARTDRCPFCNEAQ